MPAILIYPGQTGEPVALSAVLREAHDEARRARQAEIDARKKAGIPLDDSTDWRALAATADALRAACDARDAPRVADLARVAVASTEGNALEPIGEYVADPDHEGIVLTLRVVDEATRRQWNAQTQAAWMTIRAAMRSDDVLARREGYDRLERVYESIVVGVVAKLEGLRGLRDTVAESMPALRLAGLLVPLYSASRYFLELPPGKALRCGLQPPSI